MHIIDYLSMDELPQECIDDCSRPGSADEPVAAWRKKLNFTVDRTNAIKYIRACGIELPELMSDETLAEYILWMACGNFHEQQVWERDNPDKDPEDSDCGTSCININSY